MVKLAANLSMMFTEMPFTERFAAAANAGFRHVEFMFPYELEPDRVAELAQKAEVEVVLFNLPAGNWAAGERGLAALPDRVEEFRAGLSEALDYAHALGCGQLHVMAGKPTCGRAEARHTLVDNVRFVADRAGDKGIAILLEPINTRVDIPGYFYDSSAAAMAVIEEVARPNVKLQYDVYHMQVMEGDLARTIERLLPSIGHIQIADNPGRGEPGTGEIAFPWLLARIDALGYRGFVGCEYKPVGDTLVGLDWASPYLAASGNS